MYLGIKYDHVVVLSGDTKQTVLKFALSEIQSIIVSPYSIKFKVYQNDVEFRFDTKQGFEISQLLKEYKQFNLIINNAQYEINQNKL